ECEKDDGADGSEKHGGDDTPAVRRGVPDHGSIERELKVKLDAELELARREGRRDRAEGGRRSVAVRGLEVRVVEQVERLDARLDALRVPLQAERLVQPEVQLVERRAAR